MVTLLIPQARYPNPSPALVTDALWRFRCALLDLEPNDTVDSGLYAFKRGYHSTVNDNLKHWPNDYSIRLQKDLTGIKDKTRAFDWTFKSAQRGNYQPMAKYGGRMRYAVRDKDPRVYGFREALGQLDSDRNPEGIDFVSGKERVPDSSHIWHWHLAVLAYYVGDIIAMDAFYSMLVAEPLAKWVDRIGYTSSLPQPQNHDDWLNAMPTLQRGSRGRYVKKAQAWLNLWGHGLSEDGDFGPATERAVKAVQGATGCTTDGIVGPQTWYALAHR